MIESFLEIMGTFTSGFIAYLILESAKYGKAFSFVTLWKTNVKPILWSILGSVVVAATATFLPGFVPFIEQSVGGPLDVTSYSGLMLSGTIIGGFIKALIKNNEIKE